MSFSGWFVLCTIIHFQMLVTLSVCSFGAEFLSRANDFKSSVFSHTSSFERFSKEAVASLRPLALGIQKQSVWEG